MYLAHVLTIFSTAFGYICQIRLLFAHRFIASKFIDALFVVLSLGARSIPVCVVNTRDNFYSILKFQKCICECVLESRQDIQPLLSRLFAFTCISFGTSPCFSVCLYSSIAVYSLNDKLCGFDHLFHIRARCVCVFNLLSGFFLFDQHF